MDEFERKAIAAEESLDFSVRRLNRRVASAEAISKDIDDGMSEFTEHFGE